MRVIPEEFEDLLTRPLYGHLATTRPDGTVQVNPMWFSWDGELLRFTHTDQRQKYRNVKSNPAVAMSVIDPDNPYRYLEVRGVVQDIVVDPNAAFYLSLNDRYDGPLTGVPADAPHRVIFVVRPTGFSRHGPAHSASALLCALVDAAFAIGFLSRHESTVAKRQDSCCSRCCTYPPPV